MKSSTAKPLTRALSQAFRLLIGCGDNEAVEADSCNMLDSAIETALSGDANNSRGPCLKGVLAKEIA